MLLEFHDSRLKLYPDIGRSVRLVQHPDCISKEDQRKFAGIHKFRLLHSILPSVGTFAQATAGGDQAELLQDFAPLPQF